MRIIYFSLNCLYGLGHIVLILTIVVGFHMCKLSHWRDTCISRKYVIRMCFCRCTGLRQVDIMSCMPACGTANVLHASAHTANTTQENK